MSSGHCEVLVVGSGAGGAVTAARLAEAGRDVLVLEEGPWHDPDVHEPFSPAEMVAKYRHHGASAALGNPGIAFAEGRCVGGSTEINSGLYHRLPVELAAGWRRRFGILDFEDPVLDAYADEVERLLVVSQLPGPPPESSAVLERGAGKLGWRATEFARVFDYPDGRAVKQTMARTLIPRAVAAGARVWADARAVRVCRDGRRVTGAQVRRCHPDGTVERCRVHAEQVVVCGGAIQTPALLQRSGIRAGVGTGLKFHPTVKVAARFDHPLDHDTVPVHRVTEFAPHLTIGGSASRRGHVALAIADAASDDLADALSRWEETFVYYAAIRAEGAGRVQAVPGLADPVVTYRLTEGDMSRLARGLVHLGEVLLAAGATHLYPSISGGPVARSRSDLGGWWDAFTRPRANLMTVHLTSTLRMGEDPTLAAADSHGRVHGTENLMVNDASLLPDAPGVNPQAAIMMLALRNADALLSRL
jgi:choline dehydrogenase-like flavoprotein